MLVFKSYSFDEKEKKKKAAGFCLSVTCFGESLQEKTIFFFHPLILKARALFKFDCFRFYLKLSTTFSNFRVKLFLTPQTQWQLYVHRCWCWHRQTKSESTTRVSKRVTKEKSVKKGRSKDITLPVDSRHRLLVKNKNSNFFKGFTLARNW